MIGGIATIILQFCGTFVSMFSDKLFAAALIRSLYLLKRVPDIVKFKRE
jgi:hypothetical protein